MGPCYSADGNVYTTDCFGFLLRYSPKKETIERLPLKIPNVPWRNSDGNGLMHFLPGARTRSSSMAQASSARLFEYDPAAGKYGKIRDYGTVLGEDKFDAYTEEVPIPRTMAVADDGKIFVAARTMFREMEASISSAVDINSGEKHNYGLMHVEGFPKVVGPWRQRSGVMGPFILRHGNQGEICLFNSFSLIPAV